MSKQRWKVVYTKPSDGRKVEIFTANRKEAEAFADMVRKVDPNADPQVLEDK